MKAVISNRIYLEADYFLQKELDVELTYSIPGRTDNDPPFVIKNMSKVNDNLVSIPSGRLDLVPKDYEIVDKRIRNPVEFPKFKYELRESQQEVYDNIIEGGIVNASVSWGKTFCGIAIATKWGQKTLVVVHNKGLLTQWRKEIQKTLDIDPGILGDGKFDINPPIVIGSTRTLYNNIPRVAREFGTLVMDEMHHVPSATFGKVIDANYALHKLGLSGTVRRKDGKHVVFQDYFGHEMFRPPKENYMEPHVHVINSNIRFPDGNRMPWALKINELTDNLDYRELVSVLAVTYAQKGHKVLVVSDRVQFIKACVRLIGEDIAEGVTGDTEAEVRMELDTILKSKDVIFGTQSIFSEGISVNPLSCLILATPINNDPLLTQLIGRVVRVHDGKLPPVIVDINLKGNIAKNQAKNRLGHYIREGYKVDFF